MKKSMLKQRKERRFNRKRVYVKEQYLPDLTAGPRTAPCRAPRDGRGRSLLLTGLRAEPVAMRPTQ
jgi:hypothetical protein